MAVIAVLNTVVQADTSHFERGMDKSGKGVAKLQSQVQASSGGIQSAFANLGQMSGLTGLLGGITAGLTRITGQLGGTVAGLGLVGGGMLALGAAALGAAGGLHFMASQGAAAITTLYDTANNLDLTTEALQAFSLAPGLEGIGGISGFLVRLQGGLENITPAARRAYAAMQVDVEALKLADAAEQIRMLTVGYGNLQTQGERVSTLRAIGGRGGVALMDLLEQGADGLRELEARSERFGLAFSNSQAQAVRMANIEWAGFGQSLQGIGIQAGIMFAPMWESLGKIGSAIGAAFVSAFRTVTPLLEAIGGLIGDVFFMFANFWLSTGPFIAIFKDSGSSIMSVFAGIVPWLTIGVEILGVFARTVGEISAAIWSQLWAAIKAVGAAILDAFDGGIVMAWFRSLNFGWKDIKEIALGTMASITVVAKRWADVFSNAVDLAKIKWIELKQLVSGGLLGDQTEIDRLRRGMVNVNTSIALQIRDLMREWEARLAGVGAAAAAAAARPAALAAAPEQRGLTGHDAALRFSERSYSILNAAGGTPDMLLRAQLEVSRRQAELLRATLTEIRRAPAIRRIRR